MPNSKPAKRTKTRMPRFSPAMFSRRTYDKYVNKGYRTIAGHNDEDEVFGYSDYCLLVMFKRDNDNKAKFKTVVMVGKWEDWQRDEKLADKLARKKGNA